MATLEQLALAREKAKGKSGRKKGYRSIEIEKANEYIAKRVSAELEPIMDKAIEQAKAGDVQTRKDLFDRAYGKPKETVKVESEVTLKLDV